MQENAGKYNFEKFLTGNSRWIADFCGGKENQLDQGRGKKKWKVYPLIALAYIPIIDVKDPTVVTSVVSLLGKYDNSRWYHNCVTNDMCTSDFKLDHNKVTKITALRNKLSIRWSNLTCQRWNRRGWHFGKW